MDEQPPSDLDRVKAVLARHQREWERHDYRTVAKYLGSFRSDFVAAAVGAGHAAGRRVDAFNANQRAQDEVQARLVHLLEEGIGWDPSRANGDLLDAFLKYFKGSSRGGLRAQVLRATIKEATDEARFERDKVPEIPDNMDSDRLEEISSPTGRTAGTSSAPSMPSAAASHLGGSLLPAGVASRIVWGVAASLQPHDRQFISLVYLHDFAEFEAATVLDLSYGNARKRLSEARHECVKDLLIRIGLLHRVGLLSRELIELELQLDEAERDLLLITRADVFERLITIACQDLEESLRAAARGKKGLPAYVHAIRECPWADLAIRTNSTPERLATGALMFDAANRKLFGPCKVSDIEAALKACFDAIKPALDQELEHLSSTFAEAQQEHLKKEVPAPTQLAFAHLVFAREPHLCRVWRQQRQPTTAGAELEKAVDAMRDVAEKYNWKPEHFETVLASLGDSPPRAVIAALVAGRSLDWVESLTGQSRDKLQALAAGRRADVDEVIRFLHSETENNALRGALDGVRRWIAGMGWPRVRAEGEEEGTMLNYALETINALQSKAGGKPFAGRLVDDALSSALKVIRSWSM